jgi:anti-anti-sigma factor
MDNLTYELQSVPGRADTFCLELRGFFHSGTLSTAAEAFQSIPLSKTRLLLDLTGVQYVSTGAWSRILELQQRLRNSGGGVVLFGLKPEVQDGFEFMELNQVLEHHPSRLEALR